MAVDDVPFTGCEGVTAIEAVLRGRSHVDNIRVHPAPSLLDGQANDLLAAHVRRPNVENTTCEDGIDSPGLRAWSKWPRAGAGKRSLDIERRQKKQREQGAPQHPHVLDTVLTDPACKSPILRRSEGIRQNGSPEQTVMKNLRRCGPGGLTDQIGRSYPHAL